jgi:hypothetical protein
MHQKGGLQLAEQDYRCLECRWMLLAVHHQNSNRRRVVRHSAMIVVALNHSLVKLKLLVLIVLVALDMGY